MNEETNVELMDDDFLGFDDADFADSEADGNQTGAEETENTTAESQQSTLTAEAGEQAPPDDSGSGQEAPELFELNWLGQTQKHTREEMIALAQKGMDRDRILQQRDAAQQFRTKHEGVINDLSRVAQSFGLEPAALIATMEKNLLRQQGKSPEEADAIIRANRSDRQLAEYQNREQAAQRQQQAAQERQQRDIREFIQKYPGVDAKTIPGSVWQAVQKGETLVSAYGQYQMQQLQAENQRLQQQLAAKAQNEANQQRSLGSMQSGTADLKQDDFLSGFDQGW